MCKIIAHICVIFSIRVTLIPGKSLISNLMKILSIHQVVIMQMVIGEFMMN
jgi:hypothetical protein